MNFIIIILELIMITLKFTCATTDLDCRKSKWGPWRCVGEEDLCKGKARRYKCVGGNCIKQSPCANNPGHIEMTKCETVKPLCQPWWSQWTSWSKCSATCGYMQRKRFRACTGVGVNESIKETCADVAYVKSLSIGQGFVQTDACFLRRLCPRVHGGWGTWGRFSSCSKTCGVGKRRRRRLCNNPENAGGGMACTGIDTEVTDCLTGKLCPVHGGWCKWDKVLECSRPCGGGLGIRKRACNCPIPKHEGIDCVGPHEFTDACNTRPCPYRPELTRQESIILNNDLSSSRQEDQWLYSNGGEVPQLEDVIILQCPRSLNSRRRIFDRENRFPNKIALWRFNDVKLNDSETYFIDDEFLVIRGLSLDNIGFYSYGYIRDPGYPFDTVCFFSVYVSDIKLELEPKQDLHLISRASHFQTLVNNKKLGRWKLWWNFDPDDEGKKAGSSKVDLWMSDPANVPFKFTEKRFIESITMKVSGTFTCILENLTPTGSSRHYITNQVKVKIVIVDKFWEKFFTFLIKNAIPVASITVLAVITAAFIGLRLRQESIYTYRTRLLNKEY